jgi:hypothetical protein
LAAAGWEPLWLRADGFSQDSDGCFRHDDLKMPFESLDGIFVLSLCDESDAALFSWRLSILQEISRSGIRVEPDPFRLDCVWNPVRMQLRMRSARLETLPTFLGESLEDAAAFAKGRKCLYRPPQGEYRPSFSSIEASEDPRPRLTELWKEHADGPFLLMHPPEGLFLTVLCLQGEALGAISWNLESSSDPRIKATLTEEEFAMAAQAAQTFALSVCGVDLVRTPEGPKILGVRAHGVLDAFGFGHPRFGSWIVEALPKLFASTQTLPT